MLIYELQSVTGDVPEAEGITPRLRSLLYARGARDEAAMEAFLHPSKAQFHDPMLLKDMDKAAARVKAAIGREKICVYGDYDADGVCAAAIMTDCLKRMGADVIFEIPSRRSEGYGLSTAAVERLHGMGVGLILTVDNGVKAYGEIDRCRELGMDVVVTDHHRCDGRIPECSAVVCCTREDDEYPNKNICGAGVAWKLAGVLLGGDRAEKYLPMAGIATMADVVPLLGENRAMVATALDMINGGECGVGVKALGRVVDKKNGRFSAHDLSFGFGPRLNAAGRMEDADICVRLLCSEDERESGDIARRLNELNNLRKAEEGSIIDGACAMVEADDLTQKRCIVLRSPDWNPGVIGIAASKIAERYYRPTVLFAEKGGTLTGSARSVPGVDLYRALNANSRFYTRFGGHAFAAGITMGAERFEEFSEALDSTFRETVSGEMFIPRRTYEAELELSELTLPMVDELELLAPFGEGNPEPLFRTDGILLRGIKRVGSSGKHIKATALKDDRYVDLVAFSQGHRFKELADMERCDAIYTPQINVWNGMRSVQLRARELRWAGVGNPEAFIRAKRRDFLNAFSRNILYNKACSAGGTDLRQKLGDLLLSSIAGTLILCFTPSGAAELIRTLEEQGLSKRLDRVFFANSPSPCAYHTAVLGPAMDELELSRFRSIALFDNCDEGITDRLRALAPKAKIYPGRQYPLDAFSELVMDRDDVARYYKAFAAAERRFCNRAEVWDYLGRSTDTPEYMARLGLDIMLELGFAEDSEGVRLVRGAGRRSLGESPTFAALQRLKKQINVSAPLGERE